MRRARYMDDTACPVCQALHRDLKSLLFRSGFHEHCAINHDGNVVDIVSALSFVSRRPVLSL